jgi:hypothetical protein
MYATSSEFDKSIFLQGDIITGFPFLNLNRDENIFLEKTDEIGEQFKKAASPIENQNIVAINSKKSDIIIISHSCDIEQRNIILIAPVYRLADLLAEGTIKESQLVSLKKDRRINYMFYMPAYTENFQESVALLNSIHYVSKTMLNDFKENKIISLSDWGRHHLGWALANMFARPILDKNS